MALRPVLDLELLRTLVFIAEEGSFTKAAERVGRTQSAVTLQMQKLEALVGHPLVVRSKGGPVEMTPHGHSLVEKAQAMLKLNEDAWLALSSSDVPATIRLGASSAYTTQYLSKTVEKFSEAYPHVLLEVTEGHSCQIASQLRDGPFDLVMCEQNFEPRGWATTEIWRGPLRWVTSTEISAHTERPLPLSLAPANCPWRPSWMDDCAWRNAALQSLKRAGIPNSVIASATSFDGVYAPVIAGRAVTVTNGFRLPPGLRLIEEDEGLPALPEDAVIVVTGRNAIQPYTDALKNIFRSTFVSA